ncbi:hypothetical protein [Rubrivirga sp.]|uniref:hypothetical protein n=1 Tax=Rubrivirga sp. TaxID=1885344 RepID=UPI003C773F2F
MRSALLAVVGLALSSAGQAQEVYQPSLRSTFVVPAQPGEAIRITQYARRPPQRGRLARRYRGIRVNRTPQAVHVATRFTPVSPIYSTPRNTYVRRNGSFFPVSPRR